MSKVYVFSGDQGKRDPSVVVAQNCPDVTNLSDYQIQEVVIDGITVKQDAEGRYCLNDVHKASGGENRHKLNLWVGLYSTQDFLDEVKKARYPAFTSLPQNVAVLAAHAP